ncbi:MAG: hypothetical protein LQ342_004647 [Letrouitia transgressa]|nr:MAG: hypothetical protein LQ342_004647 [Letrouitia transgressa]
MYHFPPPLTPRDFHTLHTPTFSSPSVPQPSHSQINSPPSAHPNARPSQQPTHPGPLTTLRLDEISVANRKSNIRRFGAGWLRPPGIPKTLQNLVDEKAEREEAEATAAREGLMLEAQEAAAQAAAEEAGEGQEIMDMGDGDGAIGGERDLDEEIPEEGGVGIGAWISSSDGEEDDDGSIVGGGRGMEGDEEEMEEPEISIAIDDDVVARGGLLTGDDEGEGDYALQEGEGDGGGRDLDDDVPEAGSYQHTDTELEDESDVGEGASFSMGGSTAQEGVLGGSVWGGSPAVAVGMDGAGGGRRPGRRSTGRRSRGPGH